MISPLFHAPIQVLDRNPKNVIRGAGYNELRPLFNTEKVDRSTIFCPGCGRGYSYKKSLKEHEKTCIGDRARFTHAPYGSLVDPLSDESAQPLETSVT